MNQSQIFITRINTLECIPICTYHQYPLSVNLIYVTLDRFGCGSEVSEAEIEAANQDYQSRVAGNATASPISLAAATIPVYFHVISSGTKSFNQEERLVRSTLAHRQSHEWKLYFDDKMFWFVGARTSGIESDVR